MTPPRLLASARRVAMWVACATLPCAAALSSLTLSACLQPVERPDGGQGHLTEGAQAPALAATAHNGQAVDLQSLGGAPTVVYFYPKDNTPGCTKEACAFRDVWSKYESAGISVIGVSGDSVESHKQFAEEHKLPFPLVSDPELRWAKAFGVSSIAGFIDRVSFLIGRDGRIAKIYPEVDPGVHADQILADAAAL